MLTVAIPKRNKLQNIIVLTPKDGNDILRDFKGSWQGLWEDYRFCRFLLFSKDLSACGTENLFNAPLCAVTCRSICSGIKL